jgi:hypothetical protein
MNQIHYERGAIDAGGCVSKAWELVSNNFGLYVGGGLIVMLLIGCVPFVSWFLFGPVMAGYYFIGLRDLRGEPVDFGMLFKGFEKFVPLMVAGLIQHVPTIIMTIIQYTVDIARLFGGGISDVNFYQSNTDIITAGFSTFFIIGIIAFAIFGAIWTISCSFAVPLIMEHDLPVGDALLTSIKAAASNVGGLILLVILEFFVALLGLLALCIGIFIAVPVIYLANAMAYRMVFPYFDRGNINTAPPPPDYYAGSFGRGQ